MPIHDWTRVTPGTFHAFHVAWIAEIQRCLNAGRLPLEYYALAEQVATQIGPDVLTLQDTGLQGVNPDEDASSGGEPGGMHNNISDALLLAARRRQIVIRHTTGDRIVALLEIVSPGNKEKLSTFEQFVEKAVGALDDGLHLQILDLFPPGTFDPDGIHGVLWSRLGGVYHPPPDEPLTLASYAAAGAVTCYVEPTAVGIPLIDMPLFLTPGRYVNVPLERTYVAAYEGLPQRWKRVIEGKGH